jgi:hypothetical protein
VRRSCTQRAPPFLASDNAPQSDSIVADLLAMADDPEGFAEA